MYKVYIPVMNHKLSEKSKKALVSEIKRSEATAVFLTFSRVLRSEEVLQTELAIFCENKAYLEENGITVYAWLAPSIGYGGTSAPYVTDNDAPEVYTRIRFTDGGEVFAYCPTDENFRADFIRTLKALCSTGVKQILFEDDFTLSGGKRVGALGCCCKNHRRLLNERLGEEFTDAMIAEHVVTGKPNRLRNVWLDVMGATLNGFCAEIERAVHADYPEVRLGLSANSSSFFCEGISAADLAKTIAGKNRPFMRLTGAPYWQNAMSLNANVEAIRLQNEFCGDAIDCMTEGDTYPRPRVFVSASKLEAYDMALRASGETDSILKYMIDYTSDADYETGYIDRHVRNKALYAEIERRFSDKSKKACGINVFETVNLFRDAEIDDLGDFYHRGERGCLPTMSEWFLSDNFVPTCYGRNDTVSLAFGENVTRLSGGQMKNGVITDAVGARLLMEKGVDVGIKHMEKMLRRPTVMQDSYEYSVRTGTFVSATLEHEGVFYDMKLKRGAQIDSWFVDPPAGFDLSAPDFLEKTKKLVACYYYENADGQKFLVYSFVPNSVYVTTGWGNGVFKSYLRQEQLAHFYEKMQGEPLPAMCYKNPGVYLLAKKSDDGNEMDVLLVNMSEDSILTPKIRLNKTYRTVDVYEKSGVLRDDTLCLDEDIPPYDARIFTVKA